MNKELLLILKNKKNYYNYFKENSFMIKQINRAGNLKEFEEFIKNKYHLRVTDKVSTAIDNIDLISELLRTIN